MKNILIFIIIFFSIISNTFSYNISKKDEKLLKKIYVIIDKKFSKEKKARKLYLKIKKIKPKFFVNKNNKKYRKKIRIYYLFDALEKYLGKKIWVWNIKKWWNNNLINPENIKKIVNEQDQEIKKIWKKYKKLSQTKKFKKILKSDFKLNKKIDNKKVFKTTKKNQVLVKYVKLINKKDLPKHTSKNMIPEVRNTFLVAKILDNNKIIVKYYKELKFFEITWIEDYSCNSKKLNNYLKNNLENRSILFNNIKKKNTKVFKWEFYINWKNLYKVLLEENICKK